MGHLLYLMFRCDGDVMESLEFLWDLNTPFEFFSSHPAMAPAYFDFFVWTPGKKTGTYRFHQVRAQAGSEQLLHPKKNNTRNLSANYLYRFNSWLISSSVRNMVSVFATAKQLLFLWFQLYSNHDYSLLNTNCVIRSVTSCRGVQTHSRVA